MKIPNKKIFKILCILVLMMALFTSCNQKNETKLTEEQGKWVGNYFEDAFKDIKPGKDRKLTDDEIKHIKDVFVEKFPGSETEDIKNITSNFFNAGSYSNPKEIDLESFIRYFPSKYIEENTEEYNTKIEKLKKLDNFSEYESSSKIMPLVEIDKNLVDATLQKYAGIVSDDISQKDKALYLKEYDAYYTFVSDSSIGTFYPREGEIKGNDLILKENASRTLTLENKDGKYIIKSYTEK